MCGRYVSPEESELNREYLIDRRNADVQIVRLLEGYRRSFNVAPTQAVPVVRVIRDADGRREAVCLRWGLVPFWAKGETPKYSTINATMEKLESGPAWRGPWKRSQRCVMPCSGFYEWHINPDGSKTPYFIRPSEDNTTFAFAAIWDSSISAEGEIVESCAVITMPANAMMAEVHNARQRMPAILEKEDIELWLSGTPDQAKTLLKQYPSELMRAHIVSTRVNTPKNNDERLIDAIEQD